VKTVVRFLPPLAGIAACAAILLSGFGPTAPTESGFLAYRVPAGGTVEFAVDPADEELELASAAVALEGIAEWALVMELHEGSEVIWRGRAALTSMAGGGTANGEPVARERMLRVVPPPRRGEGKLVVRVEGGDALVRMLRRSEGPAKEQTVRRLGNRASPFGWEYLPPDALDAVRDEPLRRRAALAPSPPLVRMVAAPTPRDPLPPIEPHIFERVVPALGAAWTAAGPGALRVVLEADDPVEATITTIDQAGAVSSRAMEIGRDESALLDLAVQGALTAEVTVERGELRARAATFGGARQLGRGLDGGFTPDRRELTVWRLTPDGAPLRATLVDGMARVLVRPRDAGLARIGWRVLDPTGRVVDGAAFAPFSPSVFETARGEDGVEISEPTALLAAGPPGSVLELLAGDGPVDVALEASDLELGAELEPAYLVPLDGARLRYAPHLRRRWTAFRPDNHAELEAIDLVAQVRLEPTGPGEEPGPYRSIDPLAPRVEQRLVEEVEAARRFRPFHRAGFATNQAVRLDVPAGAVAGRLVVDYLVTPDALGGALTVLVDGDAVLERRVESPRGRIRLKTLAPGGHDIRVDGAPGLVLAQAAPVRFARTWAERSVWRFERGAALTVPIDLGPLEGKTLHAVVYTDDPRTPVTLRVEIDGGARAPAVHATGARTRTARLLEGATRPAVTRWLDQAGDADGRAVFPIRLGADLGAGRHLVRVTLAEGPPRAHVRFFVTGVPRDLRRPEVTVEWDRD
jgi:hypothetical protein